MLAILIIRSLQNEEKWDWCGFAIGKVLPLDKRRVVKSGPVPLFLSDRARFPRARRKRGTGPVFGGRRTKGANRTRRKPHQSPFAFRLYSIQRTIEELPHENSF